MTDISKFTASQLAELKAEIARREAELEREVWPKVGDVYLFLYPTGTISRDEWGGYEYDKMCRDYIGIQPDTPQGRWNLLAQRDRIIASRIPIIDGKPFQPKENDRTWLVMWSGEITEITFHEVRQHYLNRGVLWPTEELAQAHLDKFAPAFRHQLDTEYISPLGDGE